MIRDIIRGHLGLDILAVVAMIATLAVGEYLAALIIVLMLSGLPADTLIRVGLARGMESWALAYSCKRPSNAPGGPVPAWSCCPLLACRLQNDRWAILH